MKKISILAIKDQLFCKHIGKLFRSLGWQVHLITHEKEVKAIKGSDYLITIAFNMGRTVKNGVRHLAKLQCDLNNIPIIYIDRGCFDNTEKKTGSLIKTVTFKYPKSRGIGYAEKERHNDERVKYVLENNNIDLHEWRNHESPYYTIYVHNTFGYSSINTTNKDQQKAIADIIAQAQRSYGEENVSVSYHPSYKLISHKVKPCLDLRKSFNKDRASIGWHTNTLCLSIVAGIPIVCFDTDCMAYEVSSNMLDHIKYPDRTEWLNVISYTQWHNNEITSGKTFEFMGVI